MPYHTWNSTFCFTQNYNLQLPFHTNHGKAENWASYHSVMPLVRSNCEKSTITCWPEQNFKIQSVIHTIAEMWQPQRAIHCFFAIHVWNDSIFQHWTIINWSWKCRGSCICLTHGFFFLCMKWKSPSLSEVLPCQCPFSPVCGTSCYFSLPHPTSWFLLPQVTRRIQTCDETVPDISSTSVPLSATTSRW